jgi:hypothetical protein
MIYVLGMAVVIMLVAAIVAIKALNNEIEVGRMTEEEYKRATTRTTKDVIGSRPRLSLKTLG